MLRKGSLSLSINAIVVLILAITILGLGLGFIRSQFGSMTKQFGQVSDEIQKDLTDKIRTSGELLVFNKVNIDAKKGIQSEFYIGINNANSETRCHNLTIKCVNALTIGSTCPNGDGSIVGGQGVGTSKWFEVFTHVDIASQDVGVFPVYLQVPSATQDTYLMELRIDQCNGYACPCPVPVAPVLSNWQIGWQKKQFYVTVK